MHHRFGTHPDIPDVRDREYLPATTRRLPREVDLRPSMPPVYNQGRLNSCSAHAIGAALWYEERRRGHAEAPSPSRLFLYYNERRHERVVHHNVPVSLRDGYRSVATRGICPEAMWPYRVHQYDRQPTAACYRAARRTRALAYYRLHRNLRTMQACLAEGNPFTLGVSVHESFMSAAVKRTGEVPQPRAHEKLLGGHAMLIVGYHSEHERFIVRNSWGTGWGAGGYGFLPFAFMLHESLSWDFWTCALVGR